MKDIAVVTGGSRGIGLEIARLAAARYKVFNLSRFAPAAAGETQFNSLTCDITKPEDVKAAFQLISKSGIPKVLVNCAGFVQPKSIIETTFEEWEYQLRVNLTGGFLCVKEFLRYNQTGGKIINIASTAGTRPSPGWAAYGAAKAGLINLSQSLSAELRSNDIKVYCLVPGRCATDLRRRLAPDEDMSRIMQPGEVANLVFYLINYDDVLSGHPLVISK